MSSDDSKHVQTELSDEEYERFRSFADERGLSIREAGREAMLEWVQRQQQADPDDPAFTVLDELEATSAETAATDARAVDDLEDEWHGSDVAFTLADDPSGGS